MPHLYSWRACSVSRSWSPGWATVPSTYSPLQYKGNRRSPNPDCGFYSRQDNKQKIWHVPLGRVISGRPWADVSGMGLNSEFPTVLSGMPIRLDCGRPCQVPGVRSVRICARYGQREVGMCGACRFWKGGRADGSISIPCVVPTQFPHGRSTEVWKLYCKMCVVHYVPQSLKNHVKFIKMRSSIIHIHPKPFRHCWK